MPNQNYRVRIKPHIKLKLALCFFALVAVLSIVLWFFINSNFYNSVDNFEFKQTFTAKPISIRKSGKYHFHDLAMFKMPSGEYKEVKVNANTAVNENYCFSHVYKNGKFIKYQLVTYKNCI